MVSEGYTLFISWGRKQSFRIRRLRDQKGSGKEPGREKRDDKKSKGKPRSFSGGRYTACQ